MEFFAIPEQWSNCINLALWEPDFFVPNESLEAGFDAAMAGRTKYEQTNGMTALREASANRILQEQKPNYDPESEVLITARGTEALSIVLLALVDPGDEVFVPNLGLSAYLTCVALSEGRVVSMAL